MFCRKCAHYLKSRQTSKCRFTKEWLNHTDLILYIRHNFPSTQLNAPFDFEKKKKKRHGNKKRPVVLSKGRGVKETKQWTVEQTAKTTTRRRVKVRKTAPSVWTESGVRELSSVPTRFARTVSTRCSGWSPRAPSATRSTASTRATSRAAPWRRGAPGRGSPGTTTAVPSSYSTVSPRGSKGLSTQTPASGTAAPFAPPSSRPARRVRRSWGCWRGPSTGGSSSPWDAQLPQVSTTSSRGTISTTRPASQEDRNSKHMFWLPWSIVLVKSSGRASSQRSHGRWIMGKEDYFIQFSHACHWLVNFSKLHFFFNSDTLMWCQRVTWRSMTLFLLMQKQSETDSVEYTDIFQHIYEQLYFSSKYFFAMLTIIVPQIKCSSRRWWHLLSHLIKGQSSKFAVIIQNVVCQFSVYVHGRFYYLWKKAHKSASHNSYSILMFQIIIYVILLILAKNAIFILFEWLLCGSLFETISTLSKKI